ncbi:hypothetical protein E2C01_038636 [Portunus trituberculatus]|uniref:Uncharacterized protein n=1 Tax=Portunus trituberculatus TaxID=210409 RepID=A0A5B7FKL6_PORTR|nr:hypothetical protein [Portunus trituberculatus]
MVHYEPTRSKAVTRRIRVPLNSSPSTSPTIATPPPHPTSIPPHPIPPHPPDLDLIPLAEEDVPPEHHLGLVGVAGVLGLDWHLCESLEQLPPVAPHLQDSLVWLQLDLCQGSDRVCCVLYARLGESPQGKETNMDNLTT